MDIYHVYTDGTSRKLWFYDDEDFKMGMNSVPICSVAAGVSIYCFCLMNNHVHFIIEGEKDKCIKFIREYKRARSRQLSKKHHLSDTLSDSEIGIKKITDMNYLKTAIAYVLRNPTAAELKIIPSGYPWSSANVYFSQKVLLKNGCRRLGEIGFNKQREMFKSAVHLPSDYIVTGDGIISPESYVNCTAVENLYKSPKQLLFYLSSTKDMDEELENGILAKSRYGDSELKATLDRICFEKFNRDYSLVKIEERYFLAREMRKRYGVGPKQLARITSLDYESLKILL